MIHDIFFLILGLTLLVVGANYVTDGAVAVARRFNVSNLIIGLTVVAIGSTMPDIVVCFESALQHKPAMALGEVIGSNIFDLLLVVGVMALIRPIKISGIMRSQDLPILFIASAALWVAGDTIIFDLTHHNIINRSSGIMLLVIFIFYLWFMILSSKSNPKTAEEMDSVPDSDISSSAASLDSNGGIASSHRLKGELMAVNMKMKSLRSKHWFSWVLIIAGLGALVVGGNWVVDGASGLALKIGMSQAMVAITIVAIGNALPDLVTSVTATVKNASGLAFGNIVGSCIINALLNIGLSSLVIPLDGDSIGFVDFFTLVCASAVLWLFPALSRTHRIGRVFGVILCLLYGGYMAFTIIRG